MHAILLIGSTVLIMATIRCATIAIIKAISERVDPVSPATQRRAEQLQKALDNLDSQIADK